jgi:hypothetical protein
MELVEGMVPFMVRTVSIRSLKTPRKAGAACWLQNLSDLFLGEHRGLWHDEGVDDGLQEGQFGEGPQGFVDAPEDPKPLQ